MISCNFSQKQNYRSNNFLNIIVSSDPFHECKILLIDNTYKERILGWCISFSSMCGLQPQLLPRTGTTRWGLGATGRGNTSSKPQWWLCGSLWLRGILQPGSGRFLRWSEGYLLLWSIMQCWDINLVRPVSYYTYYKGMAKNFKVVVCRHFLVKRPLPKKHRFHTRSESLSKHLYSLTHSAPIVHIL